MFQRLKEYLKRRRLEKYFERKEQMAEVLRNTPRPDREKLKEESRLFIQMISEKRAARSSIEGTNDNLQFEISGKDYELLKKFEKQHEGCKCGMAGEKFSYHFAPSGMGLAITVTCSCRQNLLLGNFMDRELSEYDEEEHKVLTENDLRWRAFEKFVKIMRKLRNPRMFQACWAKPQNFDTIYAYAVGAATYSEPEEGLIVRAMPYADEMGEIYKNGTDEEKIERFYEMFEKKVKVIQQEKMVDVLKTLREQGLQNPMEMEEINSFIEEGRKKKDL